MLFNTGALFLHLSQNNNRDITLLSPLLRDNLEVSRHKIMHLLPCLSRVLISASILFHSPRVRSSYQLLLSSKYRKSCFKFRSSSIFVIHSACCNRLLACCCLVVLLRAYQKITTFSPFKNCSFQIYFKFAVVLFFVCISIFGGVK